MTLHPTLSQTNIWRSIKKFFLDGMDSSTKIYFDRILSAPESDTPDQWICVMLHEIDPKVVSEAFMPVYMFSRNDPEGDNLYLLRDDVMEIFFDGYISLYDTTKDPWEKVGGIKVNLRPQSKIVYSPDQVKMVYMLSLLKWGAQWS